MQTLYANLPQSVKFYGRKYRIDMDFRTVIAAIDIESDVRLTPEMKVEWEVARLVPKFRGTLSKKAELRKMLFSEYIYTSHRKSSGGGKKTFDFKFDCDLIYSSFMAAYQIDLFNCKFLHWWKFMALFSGLPESTKMREVMGIRQRELPKPNNYNADEIRSLMGLKQYYALPGDLSGAKSLSDGLKDMWTSLKNMAVKS